MRRAAISHGVATAQCLRDYYRLDVPSTGLASVKVAVDELVEAGELLPVQIEGWNEPAYLHRDAALPRKMHGAGAAQPVRPGGLGARAHRDASSTSTTGSRSTCREPKRVFGYYVLPFLLGDRIVGRVDLKADRKDGVLRVLGTYAEPGAPEETAHELADELRSMAEWLGLSAIEVRPRGDLAPALSASLPTAVLPG